ncbi:ABC transporter substrate-binding protein [Psychroserpens sp. MEBiC05023]
MVTSFTQKEREFWLEGTPKRIISLVPSQTELLVDLGLESSIVGITKFCVHPKHLRQSIRVVGGTKQVNFDTIKTLKPDIILCNKEENTKEMVSLLEHIAPVHVSDILNLNDALLLIRNYGLMFSVETEAQDIIQRIVQESQSFENFVKAKPKLKVAYFIWKKPWMVAAKQTFIDAILELNNFENYFERLDRYPEVDIDKMTKGLDVILLSSEPFPFKIADKETLKELFPNVKIELVDGEYFSWYGSRLINAFKYFKTLHQGL